MKLKACGISDLGKVRKNNEDNFLINSFYKNNPAQKKIQQNDSDQRKQYLYAICDGMGGEEYGEQASWLAIKKLAEFVNKPLDELIDQYIDQANQAICDFSAAQGGVRSGTTAAILYLKDNLAHIYNIGDSRIYLWRENTLKLLTVDHSKAWQMAEIGILDFEAAEKHPSRHILTQHLGLNPAEINLNAHKVSPFPVQKKDLFLLCSDGLNDMLDKREIAAILQSSDSVQGKSQALIQAALDKGGRDNVTVILAEVEEAQEIKADQGKVTEIKQYVAHSKKKLPLVVGLVFVVLLAGMASWKAGWWEEKEESPEKTEPLAYALELSCPSEVFLQIGSDLWVKTLSTPELPGNFDPEEVFWLLDDSGIVSLGSDGNRIVKGKYLHLYAQKEGQGIIKADWNNQAEAQFKVEVSSKAVEIEKIELCQDEESFTNKVVDFNTVRGLKLTAQIYPQKATYSKLKWYLEDPKTGQALNQNEAVISQDGVIVCKKPGIFRIVADAGSKRGAGTITFLQIVLNQKKVDLDLGEEVQLKVRMVPDLPAEYQVNWFSSNPEVAVVDANGMMQGVDGGQALITAACGDSSQTCFVTVKGNRKAQEKIQENPDLIPSLNQQSKH